MSPAPSRNTRGFVALALLVVLVLGATLSGVFAYRQSNLTDKPFSLTNSGSVVPSDSEIARVKAVTEQFALRMDSLDSKDVPAYVASVSEVLTTRCRTEFAKTEEGIKQSLGSVAFTTKGFVRGTGIVSQDDDSAVLLIVHDAERTAESGQSLVSQRRWTVELRKVGGKWLVDGFNDPDNGGQVC